MPSFVKHAAEVTNKEKEQNGRFFNKQTLKLPHNIHFWGALKGLQLSRQNKHPLIFTFQRIGSMYMMQKTIKQRPELLISCFLCCCFFFVFVFFRIVVPTVILRIVIHFSPVLLHLLSWTPICVHTGVCFLYWSVHERYCCTAKD